MTKKIKKTQMVLVIDVDGKATFKEIELEVEDIHKEIGGWMEIVRTQRLKQHHLVAVVDEEGLLKRRRPNLKGTMLSGYPGVLVGTVMILREDYGPEGPELMGITPKEELFLNSMVSTLSTI